MACCKGGQIRNGKDIRTGLRCKIGKNHKDDIENKRRDVYLMGIYKNTLLYFAKVTEIASMKNYYAPDSQYKNRRDSIYNFERNTFKRNDVNPCFHRKSDTEQHRRDWSGEYVLMSTRFAYWGKDSKDISKETLEILPIFRETKSYNSDSLEGKQIMVMVKKHWKDVEIPIQNEPHCSPKTRNCKRCSKK